MKPVLERLEDRVNLDSGFFVGYNLRPAPSFVWADLHAWANGDGVSFADIPGATVPGANDTATLPAISSAPNSLTAPPALAQLIMNGAGATGMTVVAPGGGLTLTNGLVMHGGS